MSLNSLRCHYYRIMTSLINCKTRYPVLRISCLVYKQTRLRFFGNSLVLVLTFLSLNANINNTNSKNLTHYSTCLLVAFLQDQQPKCYLDMMSILCDGHYHQKVKHNSSFDKNQRSKRNILSIKLYIWLIHARRHF